MDVFQIMGPIAMIILSISVTCHVIEACRSSKNLMPTSLEIAHPNIRQSFVLSKRINKLERRIESSERAFNLSRVRPY